MPACSGNLGLKLSSRHAVNRAALMAASVLLLGSGQIHANTINWVISVGDITTNTNWQGNVLPGLNDIADINNAGEAQIGPSESFTAGEIRVGDTGGSGYGILTQSGGTITATNWFVVGRFANGNYNFEGGTLNKTGGGMFLIAGGNSSEVGVLSMSGTSSVAMSGSGTFADGDSEYDNNQGNAQLFMQDSASINTGGSEFWVGNNTGCTGYLDMTGGTITDSSWMSVGRTGGTGSVDLYNGMINKTGNNGTHLIIGDSNNGSAIGTGVINQYGGAVNSTASDVWLGSNGVGTYNISGGTLIALALDIGINAGSSGTLNLNGGAVSATTLIAGSGAAAINFNGGVLQARASNASFLQNFKSSQINVQPGGAIFDTGGFTNTISIGLNGVGGLTLQGSSGSLTLNASNAYAGGTTVNGATLIVGPAGTLGTGTTVNLNAGALGIPSDGVVTGKSLNFNGGALQLQNYNSSTITFSNTSNLKLGAATGIASAFAGQITGSGSLAYVGPGTLNLTNSANSYSGGTFITNGVLQAVAGSLGTGAITVTGTGLPGISSGTLDVSGFADTIGGLIVGSTGNVNVSLGNVLTVAGSAAFAGSLNIVSGTASSLPETLIAYNSSSGAFANASGIPSGDHLVYAPTALELVRSGPATVTWNNAGGNGIWDTITGNWTNGTANVSYSDTSNGNTGDSVAFNDANSGNYSVSIASAVHPSSVTFSNNNGNYTVTGETGSNGIAGAGSMTFSGTGMVTLSSSNSYTGGTSVNAGKLVLAGTNAFPANTALSITSGASVQIANHSGGSSYVPVMSSLTNSGTIDITNNAMVVHNGSIGALTTEVAAAYHNGQWNGTSATGGVITSSTAASNASHLTAVGVATGLTSFQGGAVLLSDVLVKYTYYGDANLDGGVDGSDYSRIDNGFLTHLTGWQNGDFNYDSVVNGSDYTLIDNAFNSQGVSLATEVAAHTAELAGGTSVVPEPAGLGLLAMSGVAMLGRRRRRR
jgi:fibronectin-binding autotransporter adhesin